MTLRKWLAAAALSTGVVLGVVEPSTAADKAEHRFGALRTAAVDAARSQAEAWLKSTGKMDESAFQKIWANTEATVLDRVADTFKLGNADAAKILSEAETADRTAPKAVPAVLKDEKQSAFFRANLALAFAVHCSNARVYEEALEALKTTKPEQVVDPSSYYFAKAVCEYGLIKKTDAINTIIHLLDDVADSPERHKSVASIMFVDMQSWKKDEKDLTNIVRLMDNSERRLEQARGGKITQDIQKKIVFRLDELIKEKEAQAKSGGA